MILIKKLHLKRDWNGWSVHFDFCQIVSWTFKYLFRVSYWYFLWFRLFYDGGSYHIETRPLICSANKWTGFYKKGTSVVKELNIRGSNVAIIYFGGFWKFMINCPLNTKLYWGLSWEHSSNKQSLATFIRSKLTTKTLEQGVKHVQS